MRATIGDVARHPSWLIDWWVELPWRRRPIRKLRALLFTPSRGWLRWSWGHAETRGSYLEPPEPYGVAPPLRRLYERVRWGKSMKGIWRWAQDDEWPHDYLP